MVKDANVSNNVINLKIGKVEIVTIVLSLASYVEQWR